MPETALLHCPIRGQLATKQRAADHLTFTEEKQRIDAIRYLIHRHYPRENFGVETTLFKLGNKGRNSFRTDFAVYDTAFDDLRNEPLEVKLDHIRLLAEIKRDNARAEEAKATQVKSALRLIPDIDTLGVYWDDVEQRFFYRQIRERKEQVHEAPISKIPEWGASIESISLTYKDLDPAKNLVRVFDELEIALHPYVVDKPKRYALILQLLLTKIHDENLHQERTGALDFQDFSIERIADSVVTQRMNQALERALSHYQKYLPEKIEKRFRCPAEGLRRVSQILAPINIMRSKAQVIQEFYMKFAKSLYKWDLAQYFTPHEVIDFIVDVANPKYGEHVKDPACGSADFLISAFRYTGRSTLDAKNCVWGSDNSEQATQISILNMVLNGDGKTQIVTEDSLETYSANSQQFSVVLCNPPFGTKIVEKRFEVLRKFDMGHVWNSNIERTDVVRTSQQTGILFAELCVRLAEPGGRVGIILPNGYLGNRGTTYVALRDWLLRYTRIAGIVAFPRFTFKKAGADVSASVLFLERRKKPLNRASDAKGYRFYVGNVESVGWRAGDKKAVPIYMRDQDTGAYILDDENEPILDADFPMILDEFLRSPASNCFPWLLEDREIPSGAQGWSVSIEDVASLSDLNLDPKRHSAKFNDLRARIKATDHFRLGDVLEIVPPERFKPEPATVYKYAEIERIGMGVYDYQELRGWQLPDRAKLRAKSGDIFIPHIWGCAGKWFIAAGECDDLIVTNGCARFRLKHGKEKYMIDLAVGLCSEAFSVQMRALATGSDGLAEISDPDLLNVVLPSICDTSLRKKLEHQIAPLITGEARFSKAVDAVIEAVPGFPVPQPRKSHCSLV
ncbi:MAG TPA: N-6 DNA methylase [Pyrinomonadaceae bacterium]|jgi:type I restriction enzyme M protein|nr:N-6 DNA methylase [Pyrinomonadaceae bacterium]